MCDNYLGLPHFSLPPVFQRVRTDSSKGHLDFRNEQNWEDKRGCGNTEIQTMLLINLWNLEEKRSK
jgi:hypothetical protein